MLEHLEKGLKVRFPIVSQRPLLAHSSRSRCDRQVKTVAPGRPEARIHHAVFKGNFQKLGLS